MKSELRFRKKQARIDNKLTSLMCMIMGKDTLNAQQNQSIFDLTNDQIESSSDSTTVCSDSDS